MTTTPQECPWCGAARIGKKMPVTFDCSSIVVPDRDDGYVSRTDSCYERELAALRAKLAAHGRVGQRRSYGDGDTVTCVADLERWLVVQIAGYKPFTILEITWDRLPMADTEGGVLCGGSPSAPSFNSSPA